jgi:hypothetical protein
MHPCPIIYRLVDPRKVEIIDALMAGRKLIEDDNVSLEIKDVIFALSHVIVGLVERLEER